MFKVIIQLGINFRKVPVNFSKILTKEIILDPSYLYTGKEFAEATELIMNNAIEYKPLVEKIFNIKSVHEAYEQKINKRLIKVILKN